MKRCTAILLIFDNILIILLFINNNIKYINIIFILTILILVILSNYII